MPKGLVVYQLIVKPQSVFDCIRVNNMKKILFFLAFVMSILSFSSCSEEERTYSCNKSVDTWVKENLPTIQKMTRANWLHTDSTVNIAIYRAFTPQQKIKFWQDKLQEVKQLGWSKEELTHIKKVEDFINSHTEYFEGHLSDEQLDKLDRFAYQWQEYALKNLGWSKYICRAIIGTGNKVKNTQGDLITSATSYSKNRIARAEGDCNCSINSDWCSAGWYCKDTNCDGSDFGCGTLLLHDCTGTCHW